jgi:hypothetical protein
MRVLRPVAHIIYGLLRLTNKLVEAVVFINEEEEQVKCLITIMQ